jgi:CheY-like chemotaxis protein
MEKKISRILVVDDDHNILKVIQMRLEAEGYQVATAGQAEEAINLASDGTFSLALVDLKLPEQDGIEVMKKLQGLDPELPVIILTAYGTIKSAVEAMSKGASTYLTKPFDHQELLLKIKSCLKQRSLSNEVKTLRRMVGDRYQFENIIGRSEKMKRVIEQVAQAANSDSNVYIEGESGTGKELIAKLCIWRVQDVMDDLWLSTVQPSPKPCWKVSSLDTRKGHLPVPLVAREGFSLRHTGGVSFWMKYPKCPWASRRNFFVYSRQRSWSSTHWEDEKPLEWMSD